MYYIITWRDGHKSRLFTWDRKQVTDLIWNFKVYDVRIDDDQSDHDYETILEKETENES